MTLVWILCIVQNSLNLQEIANFLLSCMTRTSRSTTDSSSIDMYIQLSLVHR